MNSKIVCGGLIVAALGLGFYGVKSCNNERGVISVSTSAEAEMAPDTVEINITVKTTDKNSLATAAKENKEKTDKIYAMLEKSITADNGDYLKTANYNARPVYVYNHELKRQVMDKYEVSNQIIVHTKNIAQLGSIIDKSIALGATDVDDLNFSLSGYEDKCLELLNQASKEAYSRAQASALASGAEIAGVQSMNISCSENNPRPIAYRLMAKGMMMANAAMEEMETADTATPIQSGNLKIFANVNAGYYLK